MVWIIALLIIFLGNVAAQDDVFLDQSFLEEESEVSDEAENSVDSNSPSSDAEEELEFSDPPSFNNIADVKRRKKPEASISVSIREQFAYQFPRDTDSPFYLKEAWDNDQFFISPWYNALSLQAQASFFLPGRYVGLLVDNNAYFYMRDVYRGDSLEEKYFDLANNLRELYVEINPVSWWSFSFGKQIISYGHAYFYSPVNYLERYPMHGYPVEQRPLTTGIYLYRNSFYAPWFTLTLSYIPNFSTDLEEFSSNKQHAGHAALELSVFDDFNPIFLLYSEGKHTRVGTSISGGIGTELILYTDLSLDIFPKAPQFTRKVGNQQIGLSTFVPLIDYTDIRDMDDLGFFGTMGINYTPASLFTILFEIQGNSNGLRANEWDSIRSDLNDIGAGYQTLQAGTSSSLLEPLKNAYIDGLYAANSAFQPRTVSPLVINLQVFRDNVLRFSNYILGFYGDISYLVFDNSVIFGAEVEWSYYSTVELAIRGEYSYGKEGSMIDSLLYPGKIFVELSLVF